MTIKTKELSYKEKQELKREEARKKLNGVKFVITDGKAKEMVLDLYQNIPEACNGTGLECVSWSYAEDKFKFVFIDCEDGEKRYEVNLEQAINGFKLFCEEVYLGMLPGLNINMGNIFDAVEYD